MGTSNQSPQKFCVKSGLFYYQDRIFVPKDSGLIPQLLAEFHSSPVGGHLGIKATFAHLLAVYFWSRMHLDVKQFVNQCATCQHNKYSTHAPYGLLQPLPTPNQVWEDISMDFITNLPSSTNKIVIWVVVDRSTKFAHFLALPTHFSAQYLASIFLAEIYRLHGIPKTIVSDRDKVFLSNFWKELFKVVGTTLAFSSSYHPQTNGQTEVLNRCLETYLRCFVNDEPNHWTCYLPLAEFWYNTSFHSAIGMSPFQALYGRSPPSISTYVPGSSKVAALDEILSKSTEISKVLKFNLYRARNRMVQQANLRRCDKSFEIGEWVYLRLQPYRQVSVRGRASPKLSRLFYGPYRILRRTGATRFFSDPPGFSCVYAETLPWHIGNPDLSTPASSCTSWRARHHEGFLDLGASFRFGWG